MKFLLLIFALMSMPLYAGTSVCFVSGLDLNGKACSANEVYCLDASGNALIFHYGLVGQSLADGCFLYQGKTYYTGKAGSDRDLIHATNLNK